MVYITFSTERIDINFLDFDWNDAIFIHLVYLSQYLWSISTPKFKGF